MRSTTMLALLGLAALPGIAMAQTAPATTTSSTTTHPDSGMMGAGGHHWRHHQREAMKKFHKKFEAANTTHDGHLTLAQAQAAGLKPIVTNFAAIDTAHRGYVTFNDVIAWRLDTMAARMEKRAAELRAKD